MPNPFDYNVPVPDIGPALSGITQAIDERRTRKRLSQMGGMIQGGDYKGAAGIAFGAGDMKSGMAATQMDSERREKVRGILLKGAASADNPEKWNGFVSTVQRQFGPNVSLDNFRDFSNREAFLAEATPAQTPMTEYQKQLIALEQQELNAESSTADYGRGQVGKAYAIAQGVAEGKIDPNSPQAKIARNIIENSNLSFVSGVNAEGTPVTTPMRKPSLDIWGEQSGQQPTAAPPPPARTTGQNDFMSNNFGIAPAAAAPQQPPASAVLPEPNSMGVSVGDPITIGSDPTLTSTNETTVEGMRLASSELGSRVAGIMELFRPEFQTIGGKASRAIMAMKDRWNPALLSDSDKKWYKGFNQFVAAANMNMNRFLNEMSGAAISPSEAVRLMKSVPNPGQGLFDGDTPRQFNDKAQWLATEMDRAIRRLTYYEQTGMMGAIDTIPLNNVQNVNGKWYVIDNGELRRVGE